MPLLRGKTMYLREDLAREQGMFAMGPRLRFPFETSSDFAAVPMIRACNGMTPRAFFTEARGLGSLGSGLAHCDRGAAG